jgi:hypothetical protein
MYEVDMETEDMWVTSRADQAHANAVMGGTIESLS